MNAAPHLVRLGFLGLDSETIELWRAGEAARQFTIAGYADSSTADDVAHAAAYASLFARQRHFDAWESLLDQHLVDVVVVARAADQDRRAEQLRKLIQVGMPVVVSHPVVDSMLVYYELDMIRRDTGSLVMPYLPARHQPAVRALAQWSEPATASRLGRVEQVVMERALAEPTRENVARQFAQDVDLIRAIAGDMTRLGAMAVAGDAAHYAGLGLQMTGPRGITARWSIDPARSGKTAQLSVLGTGGKATVSLSPLHDASTLEMRVGNDTTVETFDGVDPACEFLSRLHAALGDGVVEPDWVDAARSVELAETIDRSLAKSRTIDLHYEDYTEEGTFKGTMTSVGCGLLILGLFVLAVVAVAEQLGVPYVKHWPKVLVGVLGLFLLLQLLMLVFPKTTTRDGDAAPRPPSA